MPASRHSSSVKRKFRAHIRTRGSKIVHGGLLTVKLINANAPIAGMDPPMFPPLAQIKAPPGTEVPPAVTPAVTADSATPGATPGATPAATPAAAPGTTPPVDPAATPIAPPLPPAGSVPPTPTEKVPVTPEEKQQQQMDDRKKQILFAKQRQEQLAYLDRQIQFSSQNGFIIDPAEIARRRAAIAAIGADDPSTKRAASITVAIIAKKPDEVEKQRKRYKYFAIFVFVIGIVVAISPRGNATDANNQIGTDNSAVAGGGKGGVFGVILGLVLFLAGWAIAFVRWKTRQSRVLDEDGKYITEEGKMDLESEHFGRRPMLDANLFGFSGVGSFFKSGEGEREGRGLGPQARAMGLAP